MWMLRNSPVNLPIFMKRKQLESKLYLSSTYLDEECLVKRVRGYKNSAGAGNVSGSDSWRNSIRNL